MTRTTDLKTLSLHPELYTWGEPLEAPQQLGRYSFMEYFPFDNLNKADKSKIVVAVWVDGKPCMEHYSNLDAAMAGAIAYAHEGTNHHADKYFIKSLKS